MCLQHTPSFTLVVLLYMVSALQMSIAYSPSFTRQELSDTKNYLYGGCNIYGLAGLSPFTEYPGFNLGAISLISNGKILNATLWPTFGFVNPKADIFHTGTFQILEMDSKNEDTSLDYITNVFNFYNKTYLAQNYNTNITNGHRVFYGDYAGDFNHNGVFDRLIQYWINYNNKSYLFMYDAPQYIFDNDSAKVSDILKSVQISGQKLIQGQPSSSIAHEFANFENTTFPITIQYPSNLTLHQYSHSNNMLTEPTSLSFLSSVIKGANKTIYDDFVNMTVKNNTNFTPIVDFKSSPNLPPWEKIQYGMIIDVPSSYGNTSDYSVTLDWEAEAGNWTEKINELSSTGHVKVLNETKDYKLLDASYVPLYFDLKYANYPHQYNLIFQTYFVSKSGAMEPCTAYDISSWLAVPPPEFSLTMSNNPLEIREDENKTVQLRVESKTNLNSNISIIVHKPKGVSAKLETSYFSLQPNATGVTDLLVGVEGNISSRAFTIPIDVKMYFPSKQSITSVTNLKEKNTFSFNNTFSANINKHADLTVIIKPALRWDERLNIFVTSIITPLSGLWTFLAGVAVVVGPLIFRLYSKKSKKKDSSIDDYSQ
jgi:hypothetical protein